MKTLLWLVAVGALVGIVVLMRRLFARWGEKRKASEERFATFIAQARPAAAPAPDLAPQPQLSAPEEQLLFDAGGKAGQAGEAALAIQLYARLLARFPQSRLAPHAQAALAEQEKKLARA